MSSSPDCDCTSLEYPTMIPRNFKPHYQGTSAAVTRKRNRDKPKTYCPPIDSEEFIDTRGIVGFRKTLSYEGISGNTSHIIPGKRHTLIMIQPGENGLHGALSKKNDSFQAPAKDIKEYLTFLFNYVSAYRSLNDFRAAINMLMICL